MVTLVFGVWSVFIRPPHYAIALPLCSSKRSISLHGCLLPAIQQMFQSPGHPSFELCPHVLVGFPFPFRRLLGFAYKRQDTIYFWKHSRTQTGWGFVILLLSDGSTGCTAWLQRKGGGRWSFSLPLLSSVISLKTKEKGKILHGYTCGLTSRCLPVCWLTIFFDAY